MHEGVPRISHDPDIHAEGVVEQLLVRFGSLRPLWETRIEDLEDLNEAITVLQEGLQKRAEALGGSVRRATKGFTDRAYALAEEQGIDLETLQQEALTIARETIANPDNILGAGQTGRVFESPQYPGLCYKFMYNMTEYAKWNSVDVEADFLTRLSEFSVAGVSTPKPYFFIEEKDFVVLAMQKLEAVTVKDVCERKAQVPKEFNAQVFIDALGLYVRELHKAQGIYHRDLHEGNVLINTEGLPQVIDFNKSIRVMLASEDPLVSIDSVHGTVTRFTDDFEYVRQLERLLKEYPPEIRPA